MVPPPLTELAGWVLIKKSSAFTPMTGSEKVTVICESAVTFPITGFWFGGPMTKRSVQFG